MVITYKEDKMEDLFCSIEEAIDYLADQHCLNVAQKLEIACMIANSDGGYICWSNDSRTYVYITAFYEFADTFVCMQSSKSTVYGLEKVEGGFEVEKLEWLS